jgi:hypothetical protein
VLLASAQRARNEPESRSTLRELAPLVPLASAQGARNDANLRAFTPPMPLASAQRARNESESRSNPRELAPWEHHGH